MDYNFSKSDTSSVSDEECNCTDQILVVDDQDFNITVV